MPGSSPEVPQSKSDVSSRAEMREEFREAFERDLGVVRQLPPQTHRLLELLAAADDIDLARLERLYAQLGGGRGQGTCLLSNGK